MIKVIFSGPSDEIVRLFPEMSKPLKSDFHTVLHDRKFLFEKIFSAGGKTDISFNELIELKSKFKENDRVSKVEGYKFIGTVRSSFRTSKGYWRIVVENDDGIIHIFNESQLAFA